MLTSKSTGSSDHTHISTIRDEQDDVLCLLLGLLGFNYQILGSIRGLGAILHLDFVLSRFSESKLSPSTRSNIDIDGLVGVVEQARVHGINGVNPVKVPVFNLGM